MVDEQHAATNLISPNKRTLYDRLLMLAAMAVLLSVILGAILALKPYFDSPTRDLRGNVDWHAINLGLDRIHGFRDTGQWWSGVWCGTIPYWRPLTSYVFWAERLLWPSEYMLPREIILIFVHLCFVAVSALFIWRLTGRRWLTLLAVWLFAGYRPFPISDIFGQLDSVVKVLSDPKNLPDPAAGTAVMASLLLLMRGRWALALAAAVTGVCFKEIGFVAWPLAIAILAWVHRGRVFAPGGRACVADGIRRNRLPILAWTVTLVALIALHSSAAGMGTMWHISPVSLVRFVMFMGGPVVVSLIQGDSAPAYMAILVYAALVITRRRSLLPRFVGVLAALAAGVMLDTRLQGVRWDVSATRLLSWRLDLPMVLACLIWLLVAERAPGDRQMVAFGLISSVIASVPTWFGAFVLEHTRYVSALFMEVAVAAALLQAAAVVFHSIRGLTVVSRKGALRSVE